MKLDSTTMGGGAGFRRGIGSGSGRRRRVNAVAIWAGLLAWAAPHAVLAAPAAPSGAALSAAAASASFGSRTYDAPGDTVMLEPSPLPGYAKASAACASCHSAEYMRYQPPTAGRPYWDAMVKRMKNVFHAPVEDADMPLIVDYLVKTYGAERPVAAGAGAPDRTAVPVAAGTTGPTVGR